MAVCDYIRMIVVSQTMTDPRPSEWCPPDPQRGEVPPDPQRGEVPPDPQRESGTPPPSPQTLRGRVVPPLSPQTLRGRVVPPPPLRPQTLRVVPPPRAPRPSEGECYPPPPAPQTRQAYRGLCHSSQIWSDISEYCRLGAGFVAWSSHQ